jgi:hypothetical protein
MLPKPSASSHPCSNIDLKADKLQPFTTALLHDIEGERGSRFGSTDQFESGTDARYVVEEAVELSSQVDIK